MGEAPGAPQLKTSVPWLRVFVEGVVDVYASRSPVVFRVDHAMLFQLREFHNLLQEKKWLHEDMLRVYERFALALADLTAALDPQSGI